MITLSLLKYPFKISEQNNNYLTRYLGLSLHGCLKTSLATKIGFFNFGCQGKTWSQEVKTYKCDPPLESSFHALFERLTQYLLCFTGFYDNPFKTREMLVVVVIIALLWLVTVGLYKGSWHVVLFQLLFIFKCNCIFVFLSMDN